MSKMMDFIGKQSDLDFQVTVVENKIACFIQDPEKKDTFARRAKDNGLNIVVRNVAKGWTILFKE